MCAVGPNACSETLLVKALAVVPQEGPWEPAGRVGWRRGVRGRAGGRERSRGALAARLDALEADGEAVFVTSANCAETAPRAQHRAGAAGARPAPTPQASLVTSNGSAAGAARAAAGELSAGARELERRSRRPLPPPTPTSPPLALGAPHHRRLESASAGRHVSKPAPCLPPAGAQAPLWADLRPCQRSGGLLARPAALARKPPPHARPRQRSESALRGGPRPPLPLEGRAGFVIYLPLNIESWR